MALSKDRESPRFGCGPIVENLTLPVAASTTIYRGAQVAVNTAGNVVPASADPTLKVLGRAAEHVDNSAGLAGAKKVRVERGAFGWANSASPDAITNAHVGLVAYAVDDQTVALTSSGGALPPAGRIVRVEDSLVYVQCDDTVVIDGMRDLVLLAAADYSSAGQYLFMGVDSAGKAVKASAAGQDCIGVLQNAPASGAAAIVRILGATQVYASGTIAKGARVASDSAAKTKAAVAATADAQTVADSVPADNATAAANTSTEAGAGTLANSLQTTLNSALAVIRTLKTRATTAQPTTSSFVMGVALTAGSGSGSTLHNILLQPIGAIPGTAA